jgi:protein SCO1/2
MRIHLNAGAAARLLALSMLSIAFCVARADHDGVQRVDRSLQNWPIEAFTLVDQHGRKFTHERLAGRWTFVLVGDTRCLDPCSAALSALSGLVKRIHRSDAVLQTQVMFVSLEPADTPARLKEYLAPYDKLWIGATGSPQTLARLADDLGAAARGRGGSLALVGPQGLLYAEYLPPFDVLRLTADYLKARALH